MTVDVHRIEVSAVTTWGSMTQSTVGGANATWNSSQDIGVLYSEDASDGAIYGFLRGGTWAGAGVESLRLNGTPTGLSLNIGFRCAR